MTDTMVPFDAIRTRVTTVLRSFGSSLEQIGRLYVVRDLMGRVRLTVSEAVEDSETCRATLAQLADRLHETLGTRAYGPEDAVLFVDSDMLEDLRSSARDMDSEIPGVYWVDRLVTGSDWWTVGNLPSERGVRRHSAGSRRRSRRIPRQVGPGASGHQPFLDDASWPFAGTPRRALQAVNRPVGEPQRVARYRGRHRNRPQCTGPAVRRRRG